MRRLTVTNSVDPRSKRSYRSGALVLETPRDLYVPKALVKRGVGGYEPFALECFMALLDIAGPGAVLDIGSNVGFYGLLAARRGDRAVVGFEPTPRVAAAARRCADRSRLPFVVEEAAVGDHSGPVTLYISNTSDASNSLNPAFRSAIDEVVVPGVTLDAYCDRHRVRPAVIKIDTESTEAAVLRGGRHAIARCRPWMLVEVLPNRAVGQVETAMDGLGYTYYHLNDEGPLVPTEHIVGRPGGLDMYLLAPRPLIESDWAAMARWREVLKGMSIHEKKVRVRRRSLEAALRSSA